jgi:U32 family peptidase
MSKRFIPELLSPAGSMAALKSAALAGADAVYLSGQKFGARHYADNFNPEELEEALNYAHLRGLKVYITVNTLIKDDELAEVANYLFWLYENGADGVIVQDLGVASLARDLVPKLPLHASTQMTIHNQEGVKWAANFGFKRVILAREMKLAEIEELSHEIQKSLELEVFIHGALCYSYSGQCLFSSMIGGRSGNRGMCAQPCRKRYQLMTGPVDQYGKPVHLTEIPMDGDYLLSTRDLSIYPHLDEVVNSNISSLKIEGRMRSPEYVALAVKTYRKALESIKTGNWKPQKEDIENLKLAFNRGFTRGHILEATTGSTMERRSPGNRGLYLGRVTRWDSVSRIATLKLESSFHPEPGDGIVFTTPTGEKAFGMSLDTISTLEDGQVLIKSTRKVQPGYEVFMTRRESLHRWASNFIKSAAEPIIILDLQLNWNKELIPIIKGQITAADGEVLPINYQAKFAMELAHKRPLGEEQIREQLQKTGGTIFTIRTLQINYPGGLFCPISILNSLRRDFLEKVERVLIARHQPDRGELKLIQNRLERIKKGLAPDHKVPASTSNPDLVVWISDLESLQKAVDGNCKRAYFQAPINNLRSNKRVLKFIKLMQRAINMVDGFETELIWKWPLITPHNLLRSLDPILTELLHRGLSGVMVDGLGASEVVYTREGPLKLYGSTGLNVWNHLTIQELAESFQSLTISPELSRDDLKKLARLKHAKKLAPNLEIMVQGNQEVLISQDTLGPAGRMVNYDDNVFWGVKDNKGHVFPVRWDQEGQTQLFNSVELCLIDHLPRLLKMGWAGLVIDARGKPSCYTKDMIGLYQEALQLSLQKPSGLLSDLRILKEEVKMRSTGGITSGNFLRGVLN